MKYILAMLSLVLLTGCISTQTTSSETVQGNPLRITSLIYGGKRSESLSEKHVLTIEKIDRTWTGALAGGEDKVADRKTLLTKLAGQKAATLCSPGSVVTTSDPEFIMLQPSAAAWAGFGLIGYAYASAVADYSDLPTAMSYYYRCVRNEE